MAQIKIICCLLLSLVRAQFLFGQNCDINFSGLSTINYSSICTSPVGNINIGSPVAMGTGDTLIFDSPGIINITNNVNLRAQGNGVVIIPAGVTVNLISGNFNLNNANGECDWGDPCGFNFIVEGTLYIDNNLNNDLFGMIWSGTGTVRVVRNFNSQNDACMVCGDSCPAFPAGNKCQDDGICNSFCTNGNYGNNNPIIDVDAGPDQDLCQEIQTTLSASPGGGIWSTAEPGVVITDPNDPNTSVTGLTLGTFVFTYTFNSISDNIEVNNHAPPAADAGPDQNLCNALFTFISANDPSPGSGMWSIISGPAVIFGDPSNSFTIVSSLSTTTPSILRWTVTRDNCSNFDEITITNSTNPSASNAGSDQDLCISVGNPTVATLAANTPAVGTGQWTIESGTGGSFADVMDPQTIFTGQKGNSYTLRWTISNGCGGRNDEVDISFKADPSTADAGPDQILCDSDATLEGNTPASGAGSWSVETGTGGSFALGTDPQTTFTGQPGDVYTLRWTLTNGCISNFDEVSIEFVAPASTANAGSDQNLCNTAEIPLSANQPLEGEGIWTTITGSAIPEVPSDPFTRLKGLTPGEEVVMRWTISNDCGSNFDELTIKNEIQPAEALAGSDQDLCETFETNLEASGEGGVWSFVSGTGMIVEPENPNTLVKNLNYGETKLLWKIAGDVCEDNTDEMIINVLPQPSPAVAGIDKVFCEGETEALLQAQVPSVGTGKWSVVRGAAKIENENNNITKVNNLNPGESVLRWTVTNGFCDPNTDEISVFIEKEFGVERDSYEVCQGQQVKLNGFGGIGYFWTPVNDISNTTIANPIVSPIANIIYNVTISGEYCPDQDFDVSIVVHPVPDLEVSEDTTILYGQSVQLFATGAKSYLWSPVENMDNSTSSSPTVTPVASTVYKVLGFNEWQCSAEGQVIITVDDKFEIFVPEMFTPNGDEANDILQVNTIGIKEIKFKVFDRTGKEIFSTSDLSRGWDGTFNGVVQSVDTYIYYVFATTFNGKPVSYKGTVQLVR